MFLIIAGIAFCIGALAMLVIPEEAPRTPRAVGRANATRAPSVDWKGSVLFTAGLLLLLISLSEGASLGWKSPLVVIILIVSVLLLVMFVYWQRYLERQDREPLMRISTFSNGQFSLALVISGIFSATFTNFLIYSTYL